MGSYEYTTTTTPLATYYYYYYCCFPKFLDFGYTYSKTYRQMTPLHTKLAAETHPAEGKYAYDDYDDNNNDDDECQGQ
jgi:hypothetical protein